MTAPKRTTRKAVQPSAEEQLAKQLSDKLEALLEVQQEQNRQIKEITAALNRVWTKVM